MSRRPEATWASRLLQILSFLAIVVLTACGGAAPASGTKHSAAQLMSSVEGERVAGRAESALVLLDRLLREHAGTPEAARAAELRPALAEEANRHQAATKAAAENAEREAAGRELLKRQEAAERELADKWSYWTDKDPMTSKGTRFASIGSENSVNFSSPYDGEQKGLLMFRVHPRFGRSVMFSIQRGQLLCHSYEPCRVLVRFDERPAVQWTAAGSEDGDTTLLFLQNEAGFLQRLRASKVLRIGVSVYQEGQPIFEFQVGGFDFARYTAGS